MRNLQFLYFTALNIPESHERPEGMEEEAVMFAGMSATRVMQALAILENQPRGVQRLLHLANDYVVPNVSYKIVRTIQSYTDFINRVVWQKQR